MADAKCTTPAHITTSEKYDLVDKLSFASSLLNVVYAINGASDKIMDELENNAFDQKMLYELGWRAEKLIGEVKGRLEASAKAEMYADARMVMAKAQS